MAEKSTAHYRNRGKWFEDLTERTCKIYARRGLAAIQRVAVPTSVTKKGEARRKKSTVDFTGGVLVPGDDNGMSVAFDCKATKAANLALDRVQTHQLAWLDLVNETRNAGFLLVCLKDQFAWICTPEWYRAQAVIARRGGRKSIPLAAFDVPFQYGCVSVRPAVGIVFDFLPAVRILRSHIKAGY